MRKTVLQQTQKSYEISINQQQTTLNHLVYISTLSPELIVVCGLVATVRVCRTVGCWFDPHRLGFCRKFASLPQLLKYFFLALHCGERESLRATALKCVAFECQRCKIILFKNSSSIKFDNHDAMNFCAKNARKSTFSSQTFEYI